jgi:hypothetical protein
MHDESFTKRERALNASSYCHYNKIRILFWLQEEIHLLPFTHLFAYCSPTDAVSYRNNNTFPFLFLNTRLTQHNTSQRFVLRILLGLLDHWLLVDIFFISRDHTTSSCFSHSLTHSLTHTTNSDRPNLLLKPIFLTTLCVHLLTSSSSLSAIFVSLLLTLSGV